VSDPSPALQEITEWVKQRAADCVENLAKLGVTLDYSAGSIEALEDTVPRVLALAECLGDDAARREAYLNGLVSYWGSYLGETMRRCHGGAWVHDENGAGLLMPSGIKAISFHKVEKRLHDGPYDNLVSFFRISGDAQFWKGIHDRKPDAS